MLLLTRFASVGAVVTAVHLAVALALVVWGGWPAQGANLMAFTLAFMLSLIGHYRVTFRSHRSYGPTFIRFVVSAGVAYASSATLLWGLEAYTSLDAAIRVVLAAGVIPLITYGAGRWWVF